MFSKLTQLYFHDFTELKFSKSLLKYLSVNLLMFLLPFLLNQPQLLVGSIVNLGLIYIAINFKGRELLPAIFLPSLASVLNGVLLSSLTPFIAPLMPLIWISNALLVFSIRYFLLHKKYLLISLSLAGIFKVVVLFTGTWILVSALNFPTVLLNAMGLMQLFTISIASTIYLIISKAAKISI